MQMKIKVRRFNYIITRKKYNLTTSWACVDYRITKRFIKGKNELGVGSRLKKDSFYESVEIRRIKHDKKRISG